MQSKPFYSYLIARTKYYDKLYLDAIDADVQCIMNIGCGLDSRSGRFEHILRQKCLKVLECDLSEAISHKQSKAKDLRNYSHVAFVSIDLNDDTWPDFEHWVGKNNPTKSYVFMEGVSPYVDVKTFTRFLRLLGRTLARGSRVAYDFKLRGINDKFGRGGRTKIPFRLGGGREELAAFHEELGYHLVHMERSANLSTRLLPCLEKLTLPLFTEDALIQLEVLQ
jgi:methyltransferase (TIGR00027 family)